VTKLIEETVVELRPDTVYTHHAGDLNIDHQLVARAAATALRPLPGASVQSLYSFETVSSTEWAVSLPDAVFQPTRFEDISAVFDLKCAALQCYSSEMHDFPHPRSIAAIEALARVRGATAGLAAAEAFCVIREIVA
jgi:LmbE family N-acetylglucosaminyl deacetylase